MTVAVRLTLLILLALLAMAGVALAADAEQLPEPCLSMEAAESESPAFDPGDSALAKRVKEEKQAKGSRFSILPHKTNYLLPLSYNTSPNREVYAEAGDGSADLDNLEVKFQVSLKTMLWDDIFGSNGTLYAAYSQLAFWQAYNSGASSPFREINFEPELFMAFHTGYEMSWMTSQMVSIGFNHQSNGRSEPLSRSWNRIVANLLFSRGETYVNLRPWIRIPESRSDDDNPDIDKYLGYGELFVVQKLADHTLTLMLRNNLRTSENKGAVQVDWSFPMGHKLKGYFQYFNGYGESLVDYNHSSNRLSFGVMLTDWL